MLQLPGRCTGCRHQWYFNSCSPGRGVRRVHGRTIQSLVRCAAAAQKAAPRHQKKVWHDGAVPHLPDCVLPSQTVHPGYGTICALVKQRETTCATGSDTDARWFRHCHSSIAYLTAAYLRATILAR